MPIFFYRGKEVYFTNSQCLFLNMVLSICDKTNFSVELSHKLRNACDYVVDYQSITLDEYNWLKENSIFLK